MPSWPSISPPWERRHSIAYICHRGGEIFLLDGEIDSGTCEDYLNAIRQAEQWVSHAALKRHLIDRTARPALTLNWKRRFISGWATSISTGEDWRSNHKEAARMGGLTIAFPCIIALRQGAR